MSEKIAVLGAGSWGSILANVLVENGQEVSLWARNSKQVTELNSVHTNEKYIHDFTYEPALVATNDLRTALTDVRTVLLAVPTEAIRQVSHQVGQILADTHQNVLIIHATKGLEPKTYKRPSEIIEEEVSAANRFGVVALLGPSQAEDVAKHDITLVTAASANLEAAEHVQNLYNNGYFRVYTNDDVIGSEFGGALKNIIALAAGVLYGLGYGDNAKAALITRGLAEIRRLGVAFGANPFTFVGLSGIGDLIATATSTNSRNWRAGNQLGQGKPLPEIIDQMGMVIEGISTVQVAYELSQKRNVRMPITKALYQVLYEDYNIADVVTSLLDRDNSTEIE